jgi:hypothetical protein
MEVQHHDNLFISQEHVSANDFNIDIINFFKLKVVIHLRDPRQALLSWIHHIQRYTGGDHLAPQNLFVRPLISENYFSSSLSEKIDYQIDNYLPSCIEFIDLWYKYSIGNKNILLTEYLQLREEKLLFENILNFNNLNDFTVPDKINLGNNIDDTHIRKALPDEFLGVFTKKQRKKAYKMIPNYLFKVFDWPRESFFFF